MGNIAICADALGKQYRIGGKREKYYTFRDAIMKTFTAPVRRLRRLSGVVGPESETIWALKDVSFEVKHGEVLGIIGRNGAGKSTLLKLLARITEPTAGQADIYGRVGSLLEVGTGFHPELTGRENIFLSGAVLGMRNHEIRRKFEEIVDFAGIEQFLDTPIKRYSSGMYVRLAFAVTAHLDPEILLVDEVLAVGDAEFQAKCVRKMGNVVRSGRTVLLVSHNMVLIRDLSPRCLLLDSGRLRLNGPVDKVIETYLASPARQESSVRLDPVQSDAFFTRIAVCDVHNIPTQNHAGINPIFVHLELVLLRSIRNLHVAIAVFNCRGERLFYSSSAYGYSTLKVEKSGSHYLSAQIPGGLLLPGQYTINAALHQPNVEMYDFRHQVMSFVVENVGQQRFEYKPEDMGCVLVDVKWRRIPAML